MAAARELFPRERLEMIRRVEAGHFWFRSREEILVRTLRRHCPPPARVLDVGCGSGRWMRRLAGMDYRAAGTDLWPAAPDGIAAADYAAGTAEALPWPDASVDAVTMLDTLEHVAEEPALRECRRVLRPAGVLLLSVPAFPGLWSERDVRAGHRRRYTRRTLAAALRAAGFELRALFGYQFLLLPAVWLSRRLARRSPRQLEREEQPARWANALLGAVNRLEAVLGRAVRPPVGSTLIAVAHRSAKP